MYSINRSRVLAGILSAASMATPALALAQTTTTNTNVPDQVQTLMTQIRTLQDQLKNLRGSSMGSSSSEDRGGKPGWVTGSSTMSVPGMGDMNRGKGAECAAFSRSLRAGSQGEDVRNLQHILIKHSMMASSSATGYFGPKTAEALARFQAKFGIATTTATSTPPVMGPMTRGMMQKLCVQGEHHDMGMGNGTSTWEPGNLERKLWGAGSSTPGMPRPGEWKQGTTSRPKMPRICTTQTGTPIPCADDDNATSTNR